MTAILRSAIGLAVLASAVHAQTPAPERYVTRRSDCALDVSRGVRLDVRSRDSGIRVAGYTAQRILTRQASPGRIAAGEINVCTEYGSVEIADADDDNVQLQVRIEGFGEGAMHPAAAARRVIEETTPEVQLVRAGDRLIVQVWHSTQGFTSAAQPAQFHVRLLLPRDIRYTVRTLANHGLVQIRRLELAGGEVRGRVGEKYKGVPGYLFGTHLDNVVLAGELRIENDRAALGAPIYAKLSIGQNSSLAARTGGDIVISVQPDPDLAIDALAESNRPGVHVLLDGAVTDSAATSQFSVRRRMQSRNFTSAPRRLRLLAASDSGRIRLVSVPAAPLK